MKKKIVFLIIIVLILAIGGFFYWQQTIKEIKGSPDDYVIKETEEGTFIENKKAELIVRAPDGWGVKRIEIDEGAIDFYSPDLKIDQKEEKIILPLEKGCKIQASIEYKKLSFADIKTESRYSFALMNMKSINFEETTINNYPALKITFDLKEEGLGIGKSVSIPINNKVYGFSILWGPNEKEKCIEEFDTFLETISINPD